MTALNLNLNVGSAPATSGTYVFSVTRDQVIRTAMLDIGALAEGDSPTGQEVSDMANLLNMIVKQEMGDVVRGTGLQVWTRKRAELFLGASKYLYNCGQSGDNWCDSTAGLNYPYLYNQQQLTANAAAGASSFQVASVANYNINDYLGLVINGDIFWTTVSAINVITNVVSIPNVLPAAALTNAYVWNYTNKGVRPLHIVSVVLRDIYANDTPIDTMTVERYEALPTKVAPTNIADPTSILYESAFQTQSPNGRLYLDVGGAQDVTKHLHVTYLAPTQDLNNPGDALDYPQQWYNYLSLKLGKRACPMFRCAWDATLESQLVDAEVIAKSGDPNTSEAYFQPNADSPYGP